jgi:peptidoglycan/LPS O-acetylase OafA/YrhL
MTYTPNFYFFHTGVWDDHFSHLWSLGVEEQFYLLWPLVVLLFSRKSLPYVFIVFFLIGCATEYLLRENYFGYILPFTCFDSFGMGALFSWIMLYKPDSVKAFFKAASIVTALIFLAFLWELFSQTWTYIPARLTLSFFSLWLITHVIYSQSRDQKPFFLLNNKFLIYLGKISYGIYLFHLTLPFYSWFVFKPINEHLPVFLTKRNYFIRFENFCFLLVVASTSYYLIEMPINNLKRFIRLHKTSSRQDQAPGAEPLVYPPLEPSAELVLSKESLIKNEPTPSDSASSILRST